MQADDAGLRLRELLEQADTNHPREPSYLEWRAKVVVVLRAALGATSLEMEQFVAATTVRNEGYTTARGPTADRERYRGDAVSRGCAIIRSAIYALEALGEKNPMDEAAIDPELWAHVHGLIAADDWSKVPAAVAIFLEDKVRTWAGSPTSSDGSALVGQALYGSVLADDGPLRMGMQKNEWAGWRFIGQGLAQAVGNVDRHRIQQRNDVRRYAMGVLGVGSLLLTQLRYQHGPEVSEIEGKRP